MTPWGQEMGLERGSWWKQKLQVPEFICLWGCVYDGLIVIQNYLPILIQATGRIVNLRDLFDSLHLPWTLSLNIQALLK